jgi:hypothetical protein
MRKAYRSAIVLAMVMLAAGCGLVYQVASGRRASKMEETLTVGMTSPEVHQLWGEPDIREYGPKTEVWSYAMHANSDDATAYLLYTSAKEGDPGSFLDLKFEDGKLVSWNEAEHTMPKKEGNGFSAGFGGSPSSGTVHY